MLLCRHWPWRTFPPTGPRWEAPRLVLRLGVQVMPQAWSQAGSPEEPSAKRLGRYRPAAGSREHLPISGWSSWVVAPCPLLRAAGQMISPITVAATLRRQHLFFSERRSRAAD